MPNKEGDFPTSRYLKEHPRHAEKVKAAVSKWYRVNMEQFRLLYPEIIDLGKDIFLENIKERPGDVYISGLPLTHALPAKRDILARTVEEVPYEDFALAFETWHRRHLYNNNVPQDRADIEQVASYHVANWLSGLPAEDADNLDIWDTVDGSIITESLKFADFRTMASVILATSIKGAIIEQFITTTYTR